MLSRVCELALQGGGEKIDGGEQESQARSSRKDFEPSVPLHSDIMAVVDSQAIILFVLLPRLATVTECYD